MIDVFFDIYEKARNCLNISESEKKKVHLTKNDIENTFSDLFCQDIEDHVILHGDCWTNNFMFKSEENGKKPDWIGSVPVLHHPLWTCHFSSTLVVTLANLKMLKII